MILNLVDDSQNEFQREDFLKVIKLIKKTGGNQNSSIYTSVAFDKINNLKNASSLFDYVNDIRAVDQDGLMPIYVIHNCELPITDDWIYMLNRICENFTRIYFPLEIRPGDNIDNIRKFIKEEVFNRNILVKLILEDDDFDLSRYINLVHEQLPNNSITVSIDHNKNIDYEKIISKLVDYTEKRKQKLIYLDLGCGFPLCSFSDEQIGKLFKSPMLGLNFFCSPELVINPDLEVYYCRKSDDIHMNIDNANSIIDLIEQLVVLFEEQEQLLYEECNTCWYYNRLCRGGCKLNKQTGI